MGMQELPAVDFDVVERTGSTNEDLLHDARACAPMRTRVRIAREQTAGRGRCGRRWQAPAGTAVLLSVAAPWRARTVDSAVTLACGVVIAETLRAHGVEAGLKWPNDVLLGERKLAGLLAEMAVDGAQVRTLVIGVGLNLMRPTPMPPDMPEVAALSDVLRIDDPARQWCTWSARVAAALCGAIDVVAQQGFAPFASRFDALFAWRGRTVVALDPYRGHTLATGIAQGVDAWGRLQLNVDGASVALNSGEISLRDAASCAVLGA